MNNRLTKRLNVLFDEINGGGVFADVGCDHGYIAEKVIENALATKVIISDISEKCLSKAVKRLNENYKGMFTAVVSDGFDELPHVDEASEKSVILSLINDLKSLLFSLKLSLPNISSSAV